MDNPSLGAKMKAYLLTEEGRDQLLSLVNPHQGTITRLVKPIEDADKQSILNHMFDVDTILSRYEWKGGITERILEIEITDMMLKESLIEVLRELSISSDLLINQKKKANKRLSWIRILLENIAIAHFCDVAIIHAAYQKALYAVIFKKHDRRTWIKLLETEAKTIKKYEASFNPHEFQKINNDINQIQDAIKNFNRKNKTAAFIDAAFKLHELDTPRLSKSKGTNKAPLPQLPDGKLTLK